MSDYVALRIQVALADSDRSCGSCLLCGKARGMTEARIYQEPKNAMQSGRARTSRWVLEYAPAEAKQPDPLTGWAGSGDTREQVRLVFPDVAAAQAYAARENVSARVIPAPVRVLKLQAYADNFR